MSETMVFQSENVAGPALAFTATRGIFCEILASSSRSSGSMGSRDNGFTQLLSSTSETWSLQHRRQIPALEDDEVLVRNSFTGLNPFDWKGVKYRFSLKDSPSVLGRDGSGVVGSVGRAVTRLKAGDRVWFCANSALPNSGAFQGYSVHKANEVGLLPQSVSLHSGATLGTGLVTAAIVLFKCFQLSLEKVETKKDRGEGEGGSWIFIVSGSGSTGQYLVQLSKSLGLQVICTASKSNHQALESLGANLVLDRQDAPEAMLKRIDLATKGAGVLYAVDNVGPSTVQLCHRVLDSDPDLPEARLVALAGSPKENHNSARRITAVPISFSTTFFGHPEFSVVLLDAVHTMLRTTSLRPSPYEIALNGLSGVEGALLRLELGQVGPMRKLIVDVRDRTRDRKQVDQVKSTSQTVGIKRKATSDGEEQRIGKAVCV